MAKKKKKKKRSGARKPTYAKGKKIEPAPEKKGAAVSSARPAAAKAGVKPGTGGKGGDGAPVAGAQWNMVRRGTLEWKVFWTILIILVIAVLLQYPLLKADADRAYKDLKREYPGQLKKWEQKYPTEQARKEHKKEKPIQPKKPTFGDFLMLQAFFLILQGGLLAFLGLNIARRTDLGTPILDKIHSGDGFSGEDLTGLVKYCVPWSLVCLAPLVASSFVARYLGPSKSIKIQYPVWKYCLSYVSISVQNQIMFLLLLFSALVWLFTKYRDRTRIEPHWAAIASAFVLTSLYFIYLSRTAGDKYAVSVASALFLAASLVLALGYLYWKKGLEYSLLAGAIGFGIYPLLASLIIK